MHVTQRGFSASTALLLVAMFAWALLWIHLDSPASHEAVQKVIQSASGSAAAFNIVQRGLEATPTPTVSELSDIRRKVDEQLVLEEAKVATGNEALEATSVQQAEKDKQASEAINAVLVAWPTRVLISVVLVLVPILVAVKVFKQSTW